MQQTQQTQSEPIRVKYQRNASNPQLCIPRVSVNVTQHTIFKIMCSLNIGYIERITEHLSKTSEQYKRIIISVKWNPVTESAKTIYDRIMRQEPVYVVYDMPFYWKIVQNKLPGSPCLVAPPAFTPIVSVGSADNS